jgi:hypothetical protein
MIAVMGTLSKKNQAPELLPRPDPIGVGYVRPPPSIIDIATTMAAVKRRPVATQMRQLQRSKKPPPGRDIGDGSQHGHDTQPANSGTARRK